MFPFVDVKQVSLSGQLKLRELSAQELQSLFKIIQKEPFQQPTTPVLSESVWQDLRKIKAKSDQWKSFQIKLQAAQRRYQTALNTSSIVLDPQAKLEILKITDNDWKRVVPSFRAATQRILTQGISEGLSRNILTNTVEAHLNATPESVKALGKTLLLPLLKPNLKVDPIRTAIEREKIANQMKPIMIQVQKGDVIVGKGQAILLVSSS